VKHSFRRIGLFLTLLSLTACDSADERYDAGYHDGYAVGYNTACEIRATLVEGAWNPYYARGYADGQTAGVIACNRDRKAGNTD
jgi:hypothetical protein